MNLSRGFLKIFATILIISATSPLRTTCFCATTLSLPAPRIGFTLLELLAIVYHLGFNSSLFLFPRFIVLFAVEVPLLTNSL